MLSALSAAAVSRKQKTKSGTLDANPGEFEGSFGPLLQSASPKIVRIDLELSNQRLLKRF